MAVYPTRYLLSQMWDSKEKMPALLRDAGDAAVVAELERDALITIAHHRGLTVREIADIMDVSKSKVGRVITRQHEWTDDQLIELSVHLHRSGYEAAAGAMFRLVELRP